jgi:hypothetical protein
LGTKTTGFALGDDGEVFRNVLVIESWQVALLGTNADLSYLASAKTIKVRATYAGIEQQGGYHTPILHAVEIERAG